MRLVRDTQDPTKIDGVNHIPPAIIVAMIMSFTTIPYWWGGLGVFMVFFAMEVHQEYKIAHRKNYPFNPFKWSQNRHQDWAFPTIAYYVFYYTIILVRNYLGS